MRFEDWSPFYSQIVEEFGFSMMADEDAARRLAQTLTKAPYRAQQVWKEVGSCLAEREVIVVGAADDAAKQLRKLRGSAPIVAADGATTACLEAGLVPDIIVSDLDGHMPDEVAAVAEKSLILVHAHGDNQPAIKEWLPRLKAAHVAGTCQTRPIPPLQNHGGFTDGDRACFIANAMGATKLRLVGFAFDAPPGRYTGSADHQRKAKKLQWARRLLDELRKAGAVIEAP